MRVITFCMFHTLSVAFVVIGDWRMAFMALVTPFIIRFAIH